MVLTGSGPTGFTSRTVTPACLNTSTRSLMSLHGSDEVGQLEQLTGNRGRGLSLGAAAIEDRLLLVVDEIFTDGHRAAGRDVELSQRWIALRGTASALPHTCWNFVGNEEDRQPAVGHLGGRFHAAL